MGDLRRLLRAAGEGILAGAAGGLVFAIWELLVTQNISHGLFRLATERTAAIITGGALLGAIPSALLFLLLDWLRRRGDRSLRVGVVTLLVAYGSGIVLAAFPLRDFFFRLRVFSTKSMFLSVFCLQSAIAGYLLWRRCREAGRDARGGARPAATRRAALVGVGILFVSTLTLIAAPRWPLESGVSGRPVILVSLDTLRADRLGVLGNSRGLTPHLDRLAREGAVFEQAHSAAPWTLPSHATVFMSLLPFTHGCRWDAKAIRPRHATLAERFLDAGYRTGGFTGGGYVSTGFGFNHGFEVYEDHDEVREGGPERIVESAHRWVDAHRDEPFFLFLHTYEAHFPYRRGDLADPNDRGRLPAVFSEKELDAIHDGRLVLTESERRYVKDLYDGGVAHADRVVGEFLEELRREGILDRAILMVISDHGEELWERYPIRSPGHGHSLYQELQHVPWLVRAPGLISAGVRLREPVSLLDLSPTLQELTGLPSDSEQQGSSLAEALRRGVEPEAEPVVMESVEYGPDRFAIREGNLKVILTPLPEVLNSDVSLAVPPLEVFDLASDPGEHQDLSGRMSDDSRRMMQELYDRIRQVFRPLRGGRGEADLPADLRRQLESLGYVH